MNAQDKVIETKYGVLIPNDSYADVRKKYREAVTYYENGEIASIYLEKPTVIETPLGKFKAELLTFYPEGGIKRLFPLYGQIGGYWTEEDEYQLAETEKVTALGKTFYTKPLCIAFYPSGTLKSLTIWKKETISVPTRYGEIQSNFGFELTEDGKLKSIEPVFGTKVLSKYGTLYPYDCENYRLHAENNSLVFDEGERLFSMKTIRNKISLKDGGRKKVIQSRVIEDPIFGVSRLTPLKLTFDQKEIIIEDASGLELITDYKNIAILA